MMLVLIVIGLAVCVGFAAGGSLRPFERFRVHWWGVALAGLALQGIPLASGVSRPVGTVVLIGSYALLGAFAWVNRRLPAVWLVMAGLALNLLVIGVNGGMPVSAAALETAGASAEGLVGTGTLKHHLMGPTDDLTPLGDVIGIPPPIGTVISIGDVLLYAGVAILVVAVMLGRSGENRRPPARWFQGYRGKHLHPRHRFSALEIRGAGARSRRFGRTEAARPAALPVLCVRWELFLEKRSREPHRDRRPLTWLALDLEPSTTDLRALPHHRHAEVPLGTGRFRVEPHPVVLQAEDDVVILLLHRDPHVPRLRVLHRVHHAFPGDVVHEQCDRGGQIDVGDIAMEADRGILADLVRERLECFGEPPRSERGSMQISDQGADAVRRLLLRLADLVELHADVFGLALLEELARDVDLDRQPEEHLREIVVEVAGDLETLIGAFFRHRVREGTQNLLALL